MADSKIDYDSVAEIYDLYATTDFDVPFFADQVERCEGPVLELTSGTGRLSIPLLEAGADLTCVDRSLGMLEVLSRKLRERDLGAEIVCADVTALDLRPRFCLAILPFQSFMEVVGEQARRATLEGVHRALRPAGRFVCTMYDPEVRGRQVDGTLRLVGRFPTNGGFLVVTGMERGGDPVVERLQFFEHYGPGGVMTSRRCLPMRFELIEREGFELLARDCGFAVAQLWGDYDRSPYRPGTSPFMIWVLDRVDR